jgi:hypothetical protein
MADVQGQHPEFLDRGSGQAGAVMCPNIGRIAQVSAALRPRSGHPPAELDRSLNEGGTRGPYTWQGAKLGLGAFRKAAQIARVCQQIMRNFDDVLPLTTGSQQDG